MGVAPPGRRALVLGLVGALALGTAAVVAACDEINNHLLQGQQYTPGATCVAPPVVIDDVTGTDPGQCGLECLVASAEGGPIVFVTTECPPYPPYFQSEAPDATHGASDPCTEAFLVYQDGSLCTGDAGPVVEAGPEGGDAGDAAEAASDAAADGPRDAADGG